MAKRYQLKKKQLKSIEVEVEYSTGTGRIRSVTGETDLSIDEFISLLGDPDITKDNVYDYHFGKVLNTTRAYGATIFTKELNARLKKNEDEKKWWIRTRLICLSIIMTVLLSNCFKDLLEFLISAL